MPVKRHLASQSLVVGEWYCPGSPPGSIARKLACYFEISVHIHGSQTRETGRERTIADPSTIALQNPTEAYLIRHPGFWPQRATSMLVSPEAIEALCDGARWQARSHGIPLGARGALLHGALRAATAERSQLAIEEAGMALAEYALLASGAPAGAGAPPKKHRVLAEEVQHLLCRDPGRHHSLDEIACAVKASPFHLARVFRTVRRTSIHQYLMGIRLDHAAVRLADGRAGLTQIALELGFSSHSHFATAFRRRFGIAPSAQRRQWRRATTGRPTPRLQSAIAP